MQAAASGTDGIARNRKVAVEVISGHQLGEIIVEKGCCDFCGCVTVSIKQGRAVP